MSASAQFSPRLSFVVFSDDFGAHVSSSQHLFRHIAREHTVLWVNTIGMRRPTMTLLDLRKAWKKLRRMIGLQSSARKESDKALKLTVCQPLMLPFTRQRGVRAFNAWSVVRKVDQLVHQLGLVRPIVVSTVPNAGDYARLLPDSTVIYYCVDDFGLWPGLDAQVVRDMETKLIARADLLVASSQRLFDRLASAGKQTHLLTHGVDLQVFCSAHAEEHACLKEIPRPRAGFFGLLDDRMDQDLIATVAQRLPHFSFVLAGPIESPVDRLSLDNVHLVGPIEYWELPSLIAGLDVLIMPYKLGQLAETLSPLKLKEYLVTGKSVVSTPIAEIRAFAEHVSIATSADEWAQSLSTSLAAIGGARQEGIMAQMKGESWECKAQSFLKLCLTVADHSGDLNGHSPSSRVGGG